MRFFAPEPELGPYEQSQAPTRDLRDSTALAGLDYPTISELMTLGADLMTGQGVGGSSKVFGGDLGVTFSPDDRGINFQFRKELQDKDMGARELLSLLDRITS